MSPPGQIRPRYRTPDGGAPGCGETEKSEPLQSLRAEGPR
jgi:hypothetical protein